MILSRAPVRITLGGGGTDLPSYYETYEGFLVAGTIDKYLIVGANRHFYDTIGLKYSKLEMVSNVNDIEHNLFREALRYVGITKSIELSSLADVPAGSGLGSSGAFLVALLNTLHEFKGEKRSKRELAEEACQIELELLKEHEGKQDKYACAFGGIRAYKFLKDGSVHVLPLSNEDVIKSELEKKLSIYFTGLTRAGVASDVLKHQDEKTKKGECNTIEMLHMIKEIGMQSKDALEKGEFDYFGQLLHKYWNIKQKLSPPKNKRITEYYEYAIKHGATGGKIMGANTDVGFFMFYHPGPEKKRWAFETEMNSIGLKKMDFKFDMDGVVTAFRGGH
jgi:D-glycero-alpha-D-manno-heptose-7-phosphate kinase